MIINCGKRRLKSYRYGWDVEIEQAYGEKSKKAGQKHWVLDKPAHPANLARGLEMIMERELTDAGDCDVSELTDRLKAAAAAVHHYMAIARKAA